ncbi:MAG: hypothetical protein AABW83_04565 [Nanoarchaeota archaeon]
MRAIKDFNEFIKDSVVKSQSPDKSRANFLVKEAEQNYAYLLELTRRIGINNINSNDYVKKCYDILTETIRACMLLKGFNASGFKAHEAEISYMRVLGFKENEVQFADQMRFFRNGMLYYGTIIDEEYAKKVISFTKENYKKLKNFIK